MSFDVDLQQDLSYDGVLRELRVLPVHVKCNNGRRLFRMSTAPGMWANFDPERASEDWVTMPGAPPNGSSLVSFLLPSRPQPGQSKGGPCLSKRIEPQEDCCFSSVLPAAACFYKRQKAMSFIPTSIRGNMTLIVGDFKIRTAVTQAGVPMSFADDEPSFQVGPVTMACEDFVFH